MTEEKDWYITLIYGDSFYHVVWCGSYGGLERSERWVEKTLIFLASVYRFCHLQKKTTVWQWESVLFDCKPTIQDWIYAMIAKSHYRGKYNFVDLMDNSIFVKAGCFSHIKPSYLVNFSINLLLLISIIAGSICVLILLDCIVK